MIRQTTWTVLPGNLKTRLEQLVALGYRVRHVIHTHQPNCEYLVLTEDTSVLEAEEEALRKEHLITGLGFKPSNVVKEQPRPLGWEKSRMQAVEDLVTAVEDALRSGMSVKFVTSIAKVAAEDFGNRDTEGPQQDPGVS